jgi:hypothetical protein
VGTSKNGSGGADDSGNAISSRGGGKRPVRTMARADAGSGETRVGISPLEPQVFSRGLFDATSRACVQAWQWHVASAV